MIRVKESNNVVVVSYRSSFVEVLICGSVLLSVCLLAHQAVYDSGAYKGLAATVLFFVLSLCVLQSSEFEFDLNRRICTYKKRWFLKKNEGTIPFDAITDCRVQEDSEGGTYRILLTANGKELPIIDAYLPNKTKLLAISNQVSEMMGKQIATKHSTQKRQTMPATLDVDARVLALIDSKQRIEAIKLIRQELHIGLSEAKEYCEALERMRR